MRAAAFTATVVASLALGVLPAEAATRVRTDPAGDAPAAIDITRARYSYDAERVRVLTRVPDLGRRGRADLSISRFEIFEAGYVARVVKRVGQPPRTRLLYFDHFDLERRPCPGMTGTWGGSRVRVSVPVDCLSGHARRRAFTQVGLQRGNDVDLAPAVRRLERG